MGNVYFELTESFNARAPVAALASGQAVVYHRVAIMSKDGDWVIKETAEACEQVLAVLESRAARYRVAAPLDLRWLAGGWSSHFEFFDERRRRVRCDFFSRPPRVPSPAVDALFASAGSPLRVVDLESLIAMKHTQRAKDYAVIAPLAARLPPEREIELTTDPDRLVALAERFGAGSTRPAVVAALGSGGRRAVVLALAEEADELQQRDRARVARYESAAAAYLAECRSHDLTSLPLREAHQRMCDLAERLLPTHPAD